MKPFKTYSFFALMIVSIMACTSEKQLKVTVLETSASGNKLTQLKEFAISEENTSEVLIS